MMNEEVENKSQRNMGRYMLFLMVFTFVIPIGAAYWLFSIGGTDIKVNKGEFVTSGVQILDMGLTNLDGAAATEKDLFGHWHMMFYMNSDCNKACEEKIYTLRQIKTSFHKESDRIENILIHFDKNINPEFSNKIETHYAKFNRYFADRETFNQVLGFNGNQLIDKEIVFIIDPIGNVILRYGKESTAKDIISDMKRLLKASQIG